ncbi:MAG TPA: amino acid permease [Terriglobales bacterium]|nr:amino acid permease [Terriglobales bacterium]
MNSISAAEPHAAVAEREPPKLIRGLTLTDTILLLVGGSVGSGVFLTARDIAGNVSHPAIFLLVWVAGAVITLFACFACAELGTMFPEAGGQYVYVREAFGDLVAFLYGWMIFAVMMGGGNATISMGFAHYFSALVPALGGDRVLMRIGGWQLTGLHLIAISANALITWVNMIGLRKAVTLQNVANWMKFAAIAAFVVLGFAIGKGSWSHFTAASVAALPSMGMWPALSRFGVALIAVFWAYDGWEFVSWAAGEVKDPRRNLPRALLVGVICVAAIYISMNAAYLYALPLRGIAEGEETTARAAAVALFSPAIGQWLSALIALSCFGALSCSTLSGARVHYAMAKDGLFFKSVAKVHPKWHTPVNSLILQFIWSAILTLTGRYEQLFTYTMFMTVLGYTFTVAGLFALRWKRPNAERPYRCTGYPALPGLYVIVTAIWALNVVWQRPVESLAGIGIVALGIPGYLYWRRNRAVAQ